MERILYSLGFSGYRARLYSALLKTGKATVPEISKKASVPVNKAYAELEGLFKQGFVSLASKKPLVYKANEPKICLNSRLDEKINELLSMKKELEKMELAKQESGEATILFGRKNFFEKMKQQLAECKSSVEATVGSYRQDNQLLSIESRITKNGVRMRFIGPRIASSKRLMQNHVKSGVQIRTLDPESARFTIFDKKLVILRMHDIEERDYFSIWVESESLARILLSYFESLWEKAKPFAK